MGQVLESWGETFLTESGQRYPARTQVNSQSQYGLGWKETFIGHLVQISMQWAGTPSTRPAAQSPVEPGLEDIQGRGIYHLSEQHPTVFHHPYCKNVFLKSSQNASPFSLKPLPLIWLLWALPQRSTFRLLLTQITTLHIAEPRIQREKLRSADNYKSRDPCKQYSFPIPHPSPWMQQLSLQRKVLFLAQKDSEADKLD